MWGGEGQIATLAVPIPHSLSSHPASPPSPDAVSSGVSAGVMGHIFFYIFFFAFSSSRLTTQHIRASFSEADFFFFFVKDIEMKKNLN